MSYLQPSLQRAIAMLLPNEEISRSRTRLKPPTFRLKTLFWVVTFACLLMAIMVQVSVMLAAFILGLVMLVGAHVLGGALGTRLRDGEDANEVQRRAGGPAAIARRAPPAPTMLQEKRPVGRLTPLAGVAGAIIGGACGGTLVAWYCWERITPPAILVGTFASAVIGALAGFLVASFVTVALRAKNESLK